MDDVREMNPESGGERPGTELVERTKAFFLKIALDEFMAKQERYNLDEEFAKTKRNRNARVLIAVLATIGVVGLFAVVFSRQYAARNNQVRINQKEFEDINLRDILDRAKKLESDLSWRQTELNNLRTNKSAAAEKAKANLGNQVSLLGVRNLAPEDLERERAQAAARESAALRQIEKEYAPKEQGLEAEIAETQNELGSIDPQKLKVAQEQAVILNNERRVYDVERERIQASLEGQIKVLTEDYENRLREQERFIKNLETTAKETLAKEQSRLTLRFNPLFEGEEAAALLEAPLDAARAARYRFAIPPEYQKQKLVDQSKVDEANRQLSEYESVIALLENTPFVNSMPAVIAQLKGRTLKVADSATDLMADFWKGIQARDAKIADQETRISALSDDNAALREALSESEAGYRMMLSALDESAAANGVDAVVTNYDGNALRARFPEGSPPAEGTRYYAVRGSDEVLGAFELTGEGTLATLSQVIIQQEAEKEQPKKGFGLFSSAPKQDSGKVQLSGNPPRPLDWLVAMERYGSWKTEKNTQKR